MGDGVDSATIAANAGTVNMGSGNDTATLAAGGSLTALNADDGNGDSILLLLRQELMLFAFNLLSSVTTTDSVFQVFKFTSEKRTNME
jgi:hypothetical protein